MAGCPPRTDLCSDIAGVAVTSGGDASFQRQIEHFSATGASLVLVGGGFGGPVKLRDKFLEFRIVAEGLQIVIRG